jgi:hypothetical protein
MIDGRQLIFASPHPPTNVYINWIRRGGKQPS